MRLAFISNHPAPYRDPFLNRLCRLLGADADVYSLFPSDTGHQFWALEPHEYKEVILGDVSKSRVLLLVKLMRKFLISKYDLMCFPGFLGWYMPIFLFILAVFRRRYIICADTVEQRDVSKLALWVKRYVIRHASCLFVPGIASRKFFETCFNVNQDRIIMGAYALDGPAIERKIESLRQEKSRVRNRMGIADDAKVFLMVANMLPNRHYPITSEAFAKFSENHKECYFVMVGRGPELEKMKMVAEKKNALKVIPGCSFSEMLELYAAADVYVHGGKEPASTALVIGAIAKLPLISSSAVGCFADVVKDGVSGYDVNDYLSVQAWKETFERAYSEQSQWIDMGKAARVLSLDLDVDNCVKRFIEKISDLTK